jgi:hypothetical protein
VGQLVLVNAIEDEIVEELSLLHKTVLALVAEGAPIQDVSKVGLRNYGIHVLFVAVFYLIECLED